MLGLMKNLKIDKPIAFFDLETTGVDPLTDRIVEIAIVKILPNGDRKTLSLRINPQIPIPTIASNIHGITDEDVRDKPVFKSIAQDIASFLEGCDLGGFNIIRFDVPMLIEEFKRAGIAFSIENGALVDAQVIFHKKEPRTLEAALRYYCNKSHDNAHAALADVEATIDIIEAQLDRYDDVPRTTEDLHKYCDQKNPLFVDRFGKMVWRDGEACLNFGPHRGKSLKEVVENDSGFLDWMLRKDFSSEVKEIILNAMSGTFPSPPLEQPSAGDAPQSQDKQEKQKNNIVTTDRDKQPLPEKAKAGKEAQKKESKVTESDKQPSLW